MDASHKESQGNTWHGVVDTGSYHSNDRYSYRNLILMYAYRINKSPIKG